MITQCKFSDSVKFFEKEFIKRWGLKPYNNIYDSCIFFGTYSQKDVDIIKNHKGFRVVRDTNGNRLDYFNQFMGVKNLIINGKIEYPNIKKYKNILNINTVRISIKDFSLFKPVPLGNKIYCYIGNEKNKQIYGYSFAKEIEQQVDFEFIYGENKYDINYIYENFYKQCFINLNLGIYGTSGLTTALEMAYMGMEMLW